MDAVVAADRPRVSVYMGVSLDLQIAAADGSLDFLSPYQSAGEDYGYGAFMDTVDAVLMGRHTYDTLMGYDVAWPFGERPVVVDAITLSVVPELLGSGRSLFAAGLPRTSWTLIGSESWSSGLVQLRYQRR